MEDKYARSNHFWNRWNALVGTICAVAMLYLVYTQTPLFEGNRPNLTHEIHYSNTNVRENGKLLGRAVIIVKNPSRYPAKDVYVVLKSLGDGSGWSFNSEQIHVEEISPFHKKKKVLLLKTVPANSEVQLECQQLVSHFEKFAYVDLFSTEHADCRYIYAYSPQVTSVYSDFGQSVEQKHLSSECVCPLPDDCLNNSQVADM